MSCQQFSVKLMACHWDDHNNEVGAVKGFFDLGCYERNLCIVFAIPLDQLDPAPLQDWLQILHPRIEHVDFKATQTEVYGRGIATVPRAQDSDDFAHQARPPRDPSFCLFAVLNGVFLKFVLRHHNSQAWSLGYPESTLAVLKCL